MHTGKLPERLHRLTDGLTWLDVIDAGLAALEAQREIE